MTAEFLAVAAVMGVVAGALGAMLGLGGGVFLVPFLVLAGGLPIKTAVAASLVTVIATSSAVSAGTAGKQLMNLRLGMVLEIATTIGGLAGGVTAFYLSDRVIEILFAAVAASVAAIVVTRLDTRNVIFDAGTEPGRLGGRFFDHDSGREVVYRVRRLPIALAASFVAGNISTLLGVGGGVVKVPVLNALCGVPIRAAAATSAFMIGVTATAGAFIYYGSGDIVAPLTAATVIGVLVGSSAGMRIGERSSARWLKVIMACVLAGVSALMVSRAF